MRTENVKDAITDKGSQVAAASAPHVETLAVFGRAS